MLQLERKSNTDTLYEVVSLESDTERERKKTTASPGILPSTSHGSMAPSPPEDDEEEGDWSRFLLIQHIGKEQLSFPIT